MYRPAPLRGRSPFDGKKVLLIDERQATREVRENVLRSHGVEVDAADSLQRACVLWKPHRYHLVLLDVRRQFPGEALQFYEQIRDASPRKFWSTESKFRSPNPRTQSNTASAS